MRLLNPSDPTGADDEIGGDELVIVTTRQELVGLANTIGEALQAVDDWEFDTRVGLLPSEARAMRDEISEVLRATFRPE